MDDLKRVLHDADSLQLLSIVPSVHHHRGGETLNNRAGSLAESLDLVATSTVGQVLGRLVLHCNVVLNV